MTSDHPQASIKPDVAMATEFLKHVFGDQRQGFLVITSFPGPRSEFFDLSTASALEHAARRGCALAASRDVYFGIGLQKDRIHSGRGTAATVSGIPGGYADVDYLHPAHAAKNLPPTAADALALIGQLDQKQSVLVQTGHGWQAYWLFNEFWSFGDDESRLEARQFSDRLQAVLRDAAAEHAWSMDNTADLSRILRLPGTINHKDRNAPCPVTFEITGPRYDRCELQNYVDAKHSGRISFVGSEGFVAGGPFPEETDNGFPTPQKKPASTDRIGFDGFDGFVPGSPFPEETSSGRPAAQNELSRPNTSRSAGFDGFEGFVPGSPFPEESASGASDPRENAPRSDETNQGDGFIPLPGESVAEASPTDAGKVSRGFPPAAIGPIVQGCAWMRHCHNDAKVLDEPQWHAALTILGRCARGEWLAHQWSRPYPKYSQAETQKKLEHALEDSGPITCNFVAQHLGQAQLCSECANRALVTSPILLGAPGRNICVQESWPKPQALSAALPDVPPFDPELMPAVLRDYVDDVAERLQVPADYPAATLLVTLAGALGRRALITPLQHDKTWVIVPNLWGGIIGRPGLMKSPCIRAVMAPLSALQSQAMQEYKTDSEDFEREVEAWESRKAAWKKKALQGSGGDGFGEAKPEKPVCLRFIVNDATVEKLHEVLEENQQGVLYMRDELAGWFATLDTKGRERERPFFLEAWNGDGSYTIDRIGRGTLHVEHLCISVFGGIQPSRLQSYLSDAVSGGATDDGLAQRLQVLVWPDHSQDWHQVDRPANVKAALAVEQVFKRIASMMIIDPLRASFAPDAQELFNAWRAELEHRIRRATLPPVLESHLAKYRKLMPAIALIFHVAESGEVPEVPLIQAQRAAGWCEYLELHARRVYSCVTSLPNRLAAELGEKLKQGVLGDKFRLRDVYLRGWAGLDTPEAVRMALAVLEDAGWVRRIDPKSGPQGGRPKEEFTVNPAVRRG
jgi:hypothetical protein